MNTQISISRIGLVLVFLGFYACKTNIKDDKLQTLDLSSDTFKKEFVNLSDIASSIEYVFFETTEKSIISSYRGIKVTENYVLLNDGKMKRLLLFSRHGKFLREIGRSGKGPGEYTSIDGFTLNEQDNRIIINASSQRKLVFFTIDGVFVRDETIDFPVHYLNDFGNSIALGTHFPIQAETDSFNLHFIDGEGKQIARRLPRPLKELRRPFEVAFNNRYNYHDTLCIWDGCFDTIYGVTKDQRITPRWQIINSSKYIGYEGFMTAQTDKLWEAGKYYIGKIIETPHYFFVDYSREHTYHPLLINKANKTVSHVILKNPNLTSAVNNDLDGGYPFWPEGVIDENTFFMLFNVITIKEFLSNSPVIAEEKIKEKNDLLRKKIDSLTDLDNPILMIVKLK